MPVGNSFIHIYRGQVTDTNIWSVVTQMLFLHVGNEVVDTRHQSVLGVSRHLVTWQGLANLFKKVVAWNFDKFTHNIEVLQNSDIAALNYNNGIYRRFMIILSKECYRK